jgi:recombination protein RecA
MFSMSLAAIPLGRGVVLGTQLEARAKALPLGLAAVDAALPDAGLPRGAVVELASPRGLARATSIALAACAAAQAEARLRGGDDATEGAWCAWLEPGATLFAPGVMTAGVDLSRLLVVRPSLEALARVAVRVASSRAFSVVVVDAAGVPGCAATAGARDRSMDRWSTVVRRLALAVEGSDTTLLLLTDKQAPRSMPLPAALRLELDRPSEGRITLRVAKDRRGRVAPAVAIEASELARSAKPLVPTSPRPDERRSPLVPWARLAHGA